MKRQSQKQELIKALRGALSAAVYGMHFAGGKGLDHDRKIHQAEIDNAAALLQKLAGRARRAP